MSGICKVPLKQMHLFMYNVTAEMLVTMVTKLHVSHKAMVAIKINLVMTSPTNKEM
jgi:hypothetical protein